MLTFQVPKGTMTQFGRRCTETGSAQLHLNGPTEDQATTEVPKEVAAGQSACKEKGEG
jgi:hypothetical protein